MPRIGRQLSYTNLYHVYLRGINKQNIFESPVDYRMFLRELKEVLELTDSRVHAYALMDNHLHLLMEPGEEDLSSVMHRLGVRFARKYNDCHERVGHLTQDRFGSEPIKDEAHLRTVFRYILQNPLKAGLEHRLGDYPWTSLRAYRGIPDNVTCTELMPTLFPDEEEMMHFLRADNWDVCDDIDPGYSTASQRAETRARLILEREFDCRCVADYQRLSSEERPECLRRMKEVHASHAAIRRLTGETLTRIRSA